MISRLALLLLLALSGCNLPSCAGPAQAEAPPRPPQLKPGMPAECGKPPHGNSGLTITECNHTAQGVTCCLYDGLIINAGYVYECQNVQCQMECGGEWMAASFSCEVVDIAENTGGRWDGKSAQPTY